MGRPGGQAAGSWVGQSRKSEPWELNAAELPSALKQMVNNLIV